MPDLLYTSPRTNRSYTWVPDDPNYVPTDLDKQEYAAHIEQQETASEQPAPAQPAPTQPTAEAPDSGQSIGAARLNSAIQGITTIPGVVAQGVGATFLSPFGITSLEESGKYAAEKARELTPIDPKYRGNLSVDLFGAGGQALGQLASLYASGGGTIGTNVALAQAAAMGAASGAESAERRGLTGINKYNEVLGYGATEVLTERMFGFGSKSFFKPAVGLQGKAVKAGTTIGGEMVEEGFAGLGTNIVSNLTAVGLDIPSPELFSAESIISYGRQSLAGGVGGVVFAGAQLAMGEQATQESITRKSAVIDGVFTNVTGVPDEVLIQRGAEDIKLHTFTSPIDAEAIDSAPDGAKVILESIYGNELEVPIGKPTLEQEQAFDEIIAADAAKKAAAAAAGAPPPAPTDVTPPADATVLPTEETAPAEAAVLPTEETLPPADATVLPTEENIQAAADGTTSAEVVSPPTQTQPLPSGATPTETGTLPKTSMPGGSGGVAPGVTQTAATATAAPVAAVPTTIGANDFATGPLTRVTARKNVNPKRVVSGNRPKGIPPNAVETPEGNVEFVTPEMAPGIPQPARRKPLNDTVVKETVRKVFGTIPANLSFINIDRQVDGMASAKAQTIDVNLRYIPNAKRLEEVLRHEATHLIYQDPLVQADIELLKQEIPADLAAEVDRLYSDPEFTDSIRKEEAVVRLVERLQGSPKSQNAWQRFVESVRVAFRKLFGRSPTPRELNQAANRILERAVANVAVQRTDAQPDGMGDASDVRLTFAGEKSIQNLSVERRKFMTDSLDAAKAMAAAGKSRKEIRAVTGWFPGFGKGNEKLRYEVPDDNASFVSPDVYDKKTTQAYGGPVFNRITVSSMVDRVKSGKVVRLSEVFQHNELFAAYPEAANIPFFPIAGNVAQGSHRVIDGQDVITATVTTKPDGSISEESASTILHELQHFIQQREGFAVGGSPDTLITGQDILDAHKFRDAYYGLRKYKSELNRFVKILAEERAKKSFVGFGGPNKKMVKSLEDSITKVQETVNSIWEYQKKNLNVDRDSTRASLLSALNLVDSKLGGAWFLTKRNEGLEMLYRLLSGEIEARDVQARKNLTPEQRKATAPYSSENIAEEDAIVMFGSTGPQMSISPESQRIDQEYLAAVEAGDIKTAQRIVDESAQAAGYPSKIYHGSNTEFTRPATPLFLADENTAIGYSVKRAEEYGSDGTPIVYKIYADLGNVASEDTVKEIASELGLIVENDMAFSILDPNISPSKSRVIVKELTDRGYASARIDDFAVDDPYSVIKSTVVFSPNQIKSAEPITRDDAGNIIPPSKRFQKTSDDIRYSMTPQSPEAQIEQEYKVSVERGNAAVIVSGHELTREVYDELKSKFKPKPRDVFYVADTEVIRNPSDSDRRRMSAEVRSEFGRDSSGDPATRFTNDTFSNTWIWKSHQGMHFQIEPGITSREGVEVNQNNHVPDHFELVQDALRANKPVPLKVQEQYPHYAKFFAKLPPYETSRKTSDDIRYSVTPAQQQVDQEYLAAVEAGDMETAQRIIADKAQKSGLPVLDESNVTAYKVRRKPAPQKTEKAYKLFRVKKGSPGEVFALFVGANDPLPQGVWLDATEGPRAEDSKTGKAKVKSKLGPLAYRPGWHAGDVPLATHIGASDVTGGPIVGRKFDEVWAEVDMASDVDYQREANANGVTKDGSVSVALADIKKMPEDGLYRYKTNPNMTGQWIISGSMKVNRILSENEVNSILEKASLPTMPWMAKSKVSPLWEKTSLDLSRWGLGTNPARNQKKLLDPVTYDDAGNIIPPSQRFDPEKSDIRYSMTPVDDTDVLGYTTQVFGEKMSVAEVESIKEIYESVRKKVFDYTQAVTDASIQEFYLLLNSMRPTESGKADILWLKDFGTETAYPGAVLGALFAFSDKIPDGGQAQREIIELIERSRIFPKQSFSDFWTSDSSTGTATEGGRALGARSYIVNYLNKLRGVLSHRALRIEAAAKKTNLPAAEIKAIDTVSNGQANEGKVAEGLDGVKTPGGTPVVDAIAGTARPEGENDPRNKPENSPATDPKTASERAAKRLIDKYNTEKTKKIEKKQADVVTVLFKEYLSLKGAQSSADLKQKLIDAGLSPATAAELTATAEKELNRLLQAERDRDSEPMDGADALSPSDKSATAIVSKLAVSQSDTWSWPNPANKDPVVALVARYYKGNMPVEQLNLELEKLKVEEGLRAVLINAVSAELSKKQSVAKAKEADVEKDALAIINKLSQTQSDTLSWPIEKPTPPIVELVTRFYDANGSMSAQALDAELIKLGLPTRSRIILVNSVSAELSKRQAVKAAREKLIAENKPTKSAESFAANWQKSQDASKDPKDTEQDPVRSYLNEFSKVGRGEFHFDLSPDGKGLFFEIVYKKLLSLNVSEKAAMAATSAAYQKYLTNRANQIAALRKAVAEKGLSKALAREMMSITATNQRDPEFAKKFIKQVLLDAGIPEDIADASLPLLLPSFQKALADTREQLLRDFIDGRPKGAKKIPKLVVDEFLKAVRLGATNPDYEPSTPFAKANKWRNFTRAEHDEMARLDEIAMDPMQTRQEQQIALAGIAKIISSKVTGYARLVVAAEIYRNSALSNLLTTGGIQVWTPVFSAAARVLTDGVVGLAKERNFNRFIASVESFMRAASPTALKSELFSAFGQNITTFNKAYELDNQAQLNQLSNLYTILQNSIKTWKTTKNPVAKAKALIGITYGSMDYVRRAYASLDNVSQSVFYRQIMDLGVRDIILKANGTEADFRNMISNRTRRHEQIVTELISQGQSPSRAWVNASEISRREMAGEIVDIYGSDVGAQVEAQDVISRKETAREIGVASDAELDGHVIPMLIETIKALSKAADNRMAGSGALTSLILFGFPVTALKVMNRSLDYSIVGLFRAINSAAETKKYANDPEYKSKYPSYKTDNQRHQRMAETAVGTIGMFILLAMVMGERDKEPEDRLFMVHNAGPRDRAARQIWRAAGNEPQSVQFRFGTNSPWLGVSWAKAGLEVFAPIFAVAGATFDSTDPTIRREDAYDQVMVFASQSLASMSRPLSSIQDTAGVLSGKEMSLSSRSLANQIGFRASSFLPWSSLARNYNKWQGARDTTNALSAFAAMIPIVGPSLTEPALNSLGDPIGKTPNEYSFKLGTAIPVSVGFRREDTPLYEFLLSKGKFPTAISRPTQEKKYGKMSDETWRKYIEVRGQNLKSLILKRKDSLQKLDAERYDDAIENLTGIANDRARNQLKLRPAK